VTLSIFVKQVGVSNDVVTWVTTDKLIVAVVFKRLELAVVAYFLCVWVLNGHWAVFRAVATLETG
jgi:hypothetical protein